MLPRFEDCHVSILKDRLLLRIHDCKFLEEDHEYLTGTTPLSRAQINDWAKNFRYRFKDASRRETELKKKGKETVCCIPFLLSTVAITQRLRLNLSQPV
jgi:hypothetical protein